MPHDSSISFQESPPRVVATIGSVEAWRLALELPAGSGDLLEIRADLLLEKTSSLPGAIADLPRPVILTVRAPSEGGKGPVDPQARAAIYRRYLGQVAAIDLELASAHQMGELIQDTRKEGCGCLFSHHNFWGTPSLEILQKMTLEARHFGADLFKVATTTDTASQLGTLAQWVETEKTLPLAAMGMGRLGKISRPLLAQLGSRLNYGYLDTPLVPGQWPALELRRFLDTLL